jgi:hypothetical protein
LADDCEDIGGGHFTLDDLVPIQSRNSELDV